ncbi:hypothetical protein M0813_24114 [Anaeramoeba flamelloides]|uniref:Uncharacterized protein n=1 Tax=Anaeramoeba flamelloides TaxID=1746091 RepID=A0ABQ8Y6F9_9EUKA|nr:hypothetical protein M0813_24114 [Anaeramoeba flamelloides]
MFSLFFYFFSSFLLPFILLNITTKYHPLTLFETITISIPLGLIISSWISFCICVSLSVELSIHVLDLCTIILLVFICLLLIAILISHKSKCKKHSYRKQEQQQQQQQQQKTPHDRPIFFNLFHQQLKKEFTNDLPLIILFVPLLISFFYWFGHHYLNQEGPWIFSSHHTYSDLPFHLQLINSFVHGCNKKIYSLSTLKTPFASGVNLRYPFLIDFQIAVLVASGELNLRSALVLVSMLLMFSLIHLFYRASFRFFHQRKISLLALFLYFSSGGFGFVYLFLKRNQIKIKNTDFVMHPIPDFDLFWVNPLTGILTPQLSSLLGFPLVISILLILKESIQNMNYIWICGVLISLLPMAHSHSFIGLSVIIAFHFCFNLFSFNLDHNKNKNKKALLKRFFRNWFICFIIVLVCSTPQLFLFVKRYKSNQIITFFDLFKNIKPKSTSLLYYLTFSFGINPLFGIIGISLLNFSQIKIYLPSLLLFFISLIIKFQKWELDNLKLIQIFLFYSSTISANLIFRIKKSIKKFSSFLSIVFIVLLLFSASFTGILDISHSFLQKSPIISQADTHFGNWVLLNTNADDVFLAVGNNNYREFLIPPNIISGRQMYMGWWVWLNNHGLDVNYYLTKSNSMLYGINKGTSKEIIDDLYKKNQIKYILVHKTNQVFPSEKTKKELNLVKVYENNIHLLFKNEGL